MPFIIVWMKEMTRSDRKKRITDCPERSPGMKEVDPKLLEMAEVFHMPKKARMKYIILPAKMPALARIVNRKSAGRRQAEEGGTDR